MELRQLRYFVKVAETLNFSVAAKELFITQSTLSQQIGQMERELDQPLFLRNSHEVMLTEAGQLLLPYARETLTMASTCVERLNELKNLMTGELNIGVTFSFSSIATETIVGFLKEYPAVKMNVTYSPMTELMERLLRRELDLVLAFRPTQRDERIESHVLFNNRLAAIVGEHHALSTRRRLSLAELERHCLVLPAKGLQARNALDKMTEGRDCPLNVKAEINNVNMLLRLVRESNYLTVLSESTVLDEPDLHAIPLDTPDNDMEGCVHLLKNAYVKQSAQVFIRMLTQSTSIYKNAFLLGHS